MQWELMELSMVALAKKIIVKVIFRYVYLLFFIYICISHFLCFYIHISIIKRSLSIKFRMIYALIYVVSVCLPVCVFDADVLST